MGIFKDQNHGLRFHCNYNDPAMWETFGLPDAKYNFLEGVGSVDIIDELPQTGEMDQWLAWLCDGEYLEFSILELQPQFHSADSMPSNFMLNEKVLMVRSVYPFVPTYLRTKKKQP